MLKDKFRLESVVQQGSTYYQLIRKTFKECNMITIVKYEFAFAYVKSM